MYDLNLSHSNFVELENDTVAYFRSQLLINKKLVMKVEP